MHQAFYEIDLVFAAIGIGVPIGRKLNLSSIEIGLLCSGLTALFSLIFPT